MNGHFSKAPQTPGQPKASRWRSLLLPTSGRSNTHLLITLIVLVGLSFFLRRFGASGPTPATSVAATVTIENLAYKNHLYNFAVSAPSKDWEISYQKNADSLRPENPAATVFENVNPMLEMRRRDREAMIAVAKAGVIRLAGPRTPNSLAAQNLEELQRQFRSTNGAVRLIQPVTPISGSKAQGAYFVAELPQTGQPAPQPIWISAFWVRHPFGYSILCQTTKRDYVFLVKDLETILGSFRYLQ